jgi:hypothetical protein
MYLVYEERKNSTPSPDAEIMDLLVVGSCTRALLKLIVHSHPVLPCVHPVSAFQKHFVRRTISSIRWTTLLDIRDRFQTCPERGQIFFFFGRAGTKHFSQKWKSRDVWIFRISCLFLTRSHSEPVFFVYSKSSGFSIFFTWWVWPVDQYFKMVYVKGLYPQIASSLKVHLHSVPSSFFPHQWFGFQIFSVHVFTFKSFSLFSSLVNEWRLLLLLLVKK